MSIASASLRLRSRSLSASASSSASLSRGDRGAMPPTNVPILWTKLAARWETDEAGDGERCCHIPWSSSWSSLSSEPLSEMETGSMPVELSGKNAFRSGEGRRGDDGLPLGGYKKDD